MSLSFPAGRRPRALPGLGAIGRADLAVLAFCALGAGNLWARRGAGDAFNVGDPGDFVVGFGLICLAGVLCMLAVRRPAVAPGAIVCSAAIAGQVIVQPYYLLPVQVMYLTGVVLAAVPLVRNRWLAWPMVAVVAGIVCVPMTQYWTWGASKIDVFQEVQGSTLALLHGHNPYGPVVAVFLDSPLHHPLYGSGSLNYGPAVVLLSLPARLIGDVRLTVVALNIAILVAALVWVRRAWPSRNLGPTIAALWVASPFVPFMVVLEWTDSFSVAGLAWWLVLRDRHRNWAIACLAVALASKPTMLPLMVPLVLWVRPVRGELLRSTVAAVAVIAPFAIWTGVAQFVYDTVGIFTDLPTRHDAVNVNGLSVALGHGLLAPSLLLVATIVVATVCLARRPLDYGDMLAMGAALMIAICFFAKQAFFNYYYNAAMALLFVAGAGGLRPLTPLTSPIRELREMAARVRRRQPVSSASASPALLAVSQPASRRALRLPSPAPSRGASTPSPPAS